MSERISDARLAEVTAHYGPLCRKRGPLSRKKPSVRRDTYTALRELAELREQVRWIPVTERRPDGNGMVLVATADNRYIEKCPAHHLRVLWSEVELGTEPSCFWAWWREIGPLPGGDV
jgi:hypothetical protein